MLKEVKDYEGNNYIDEEGNANVARKDYVDRIQIESNAKKR